MEFTFREITSANRNTSYPMAPDFTFHLNYSTNDVLIHEAFGAGCIYRIFLYPHLNTTDAYRISKLTPEHLTNHHLSIIIDGQVFTFSLKDVMLGNQWPFLSPFSTNHGHILAGLGSYVPICYQNYSRIYYKPPHVLPIDLLEKNIKCTSLNLKCNIHIYSSVSSHKFILNSYVKPFEMNDENHKKIGEKASLYLSSPAKYGPTMKKKCSLNCNLIHYNEKLLIYSQKEAGVIHTMHFRVLNEQSSDVLVDWSKILITMIWDEETVPQVLQIPLSSLFGISGSLNRNKALSNGHDLIFCYQNVSTWDHPKYLHTGYFYFPMPFWKSASIYIESKYFKRNVVCYEFLTTKNVYDIQTTGYFHMTKTYFTDEVQGYREILHLNNSWGHLVAVFSEVDNLRTFSKNSEVRWAVIQSDPIIFLDKMMSATVLGTGLEDYFSYSHAFHGAENTSYSFIGVPHSYSRSAEKVFGWHSYRLHILDAISFQSNIHFIMEGERSDYFIKEPQISHEEYSYRKELSLPVVSFMVFYYSKVSHAINYIVFSLSDEESEALHRFTFFSNNSKSGEMFNVKNKRYLGNTMDANSYNKSGRIFYINDQYSFEFAICSPNNGAILQREYESKSSLWNEKFRIWVNDVDHGIWDFPMGSLSDTYSLIQDNFLIHRNVTNLTNVLKFKIKLLTNAYDISYHLIVL